MVSEIKLVISQNNIILQTVTREVDTKNFVKAIENFQEIANATLTKIIDEQGGSGDCGSEEESEESDSEEDACTSSKRIRI